MLLCAAEFVNCCYKSIKTSRDLAASAMVLAALSPLTLGFSLTPLAAPRGGSSTVVMKGGLFPKGPFGGSGSVGDRDPTEGKWVGDRGQSAQVKKFEGGSDYLFFQGPAPKTAVQDDLPNFFSAENLEGASLPPLALPFAVTGAASFAFAASILVAPPQMPAGGGAPAKTPAAAKKAPAAPASEAKAEAPKAVAEVSAKAAKADAEAQAANKARAAKRAEAAAAAAEKASAEKAARAAKAEARPHPNPNPNPHPNPDASSTLSLTLTLTLTLTFTLTLTGGQGGGQGGQG